MNTKNNSDKSEKALRIGSVSSRLPWTLEEKQELFRLCNSAWDWSFPGYEWVASHLNRYFKNNRTAAACRSMDRKLPFYP